MEAMIEAKNLMVFFENALALNDLTLEVKKGDRILFGKYAGTDIKVEGEEHLIMREDDIIAIVE